MFGCLCAVSMASRNKRKRLASESVEYGNTTKRSRKEQPYFSTESQPGPSFPHHSEQHFLSASPTPDVSWSSKPTSSPSTSYRYDRYEAESSQRCDARILLHKIRKRQSSDHELRYQSVKKSPHKRLKQEHMSQADLCNPYSHFSEKNAIHLLQDIVKFRKRMHDDGTVEKILNILTTNSETELLVMLIQALSRTNLKSLSKQLFSPVSNASFFHCISSMVCSMPQEQNKHKRNSFVKILSDIAKLFRELLEVNPLKAFLHLPIDSCCGTVEQLSRQDYMFKSVEESLLQLRAQRDSIRQGLYDVKDCESVPDMIALPTEEELHSATFLTALRKNIIKGEFPSDTDYISIFYSLVREDFIQPLREALHKVKREEQFLYKNVSIESCSAVDLSNEDVICRLKFSTTRQVKWQYSKRLTYGSLLCLSDDDFGTVIFATVSERDIDDLKNNCVEVKLIGKAAEDPKYVSPSKEYKMFESPCYFEAYAPIIRTLCSLRENLKKLPFKDYIVRCKTDIKKPLYLEENQDATFSLCGVICSCDPLKCEHDSYSVEDIEQAKLNKSSIVSTNLSQSKALCTALTRELVLIQGPPGTGKTYVGLKIVQSLLINKSLWNPGKGPIMIVCYTNHALDQFLEGLLHLKDLEGTLEIRRVGGRSKSKTLEPYNIKKFVNLAKKNKGIRFTTKNFLRNVQNRLKHLTDFLNGRNPSISSVSMYSFFLSEAIIEELRWHCDIYEMVVPVLSQLVPKKTEKNPFHDYIKAERHLSFDDDREYTIFEEKSLKQFVSFFKKVASMSNKEATECLEQLAEDGWLPYDVHLRLFKYCLDKLKHAWQREAEHTAQENAENDKRIQLIRVNCLQEADVIGVTINGAAKYKAALTQVKSKICVIEEAGEVMEPHVITTLTPHTQHLILIGDHKQLRPKTNSDVIGREYKLNISMFERLVNNDFPVETLKIQHRMRPEISRLVSTHIYDGCVEDSETVQSYEDVSGMLHNMYFVDHHQYESRDEDNTSPFNTHEAAFVVYLTRYLIQNGNKPEEITIITPYLGQLREIKQQSNKLDVEVNVSTVDNFQGEENDIILLSLVRNNKEDDLGFTRFKNRVCVAMSRAKKGFYCIGSFSTFRKKSKLWESISSDLEQEDRLSEALPLRCVSHKNVTHISSADDFNKIEAGGCRELCKARHSICNHVCDRSCHPDDQMHERHCTQPCPKKCDKDLHRCESKCGLICPPCKQPMKKKIPMCGHDQQVPCNIEAREFSCTMDCMKTLSCGHRCKLKCGQDCSSKRCKFFVTKQWPCGHEAQRECHETELNYSLNCKFRCDTVLACGHKCTRTCGVCRQGRLHMPCKDKCSRNLFCGHPCSVSCANNCPPCMKECVFKCSHAPCGHKCFKQCKPCPHRCEWKCKHFQCTKNCGELCEKKRCSEPCKKKLKCSHHCIGLCGEPCPAVCRVCNKDSDTFEVFFGEEDNPDSRFVELKDCKHVIEATSMDRWMDSGDDDANVSIMWKKCPKCSVQVISTLRYANQAKQVLADMNRAKEKLSCTLSRSDRHEYYRRAQELSVSVYSSLRRSTIRRSLIDKFSARCERFKRVDIKHNDALLIDFLVLFQSLHQSLLTLKTLDDIIDSKTIDIVIEIKWLQSQTIDFLNWLVECLNRDHFTDQVRQDSENESRRIFLLGQLYCLRYNAKKLRDAKLSESENAVLHSFRRYECFGCQPAVTVTEDILQQALAEMHQISNKLAMPLPKEERTMIIKALGTKRGSWYKCQNGHFYQIGQCGGAMETSKCPECSAVIGGQSHTLASGNQHAGEFDDSSHAAWSEGANLANYEGFN